jgi:hypothetical protein
VTDQPMAVAVDGYVRVGVHDKHGRLHVQNLDALVALKLAAEIMCSIDTIFKGAESELLAKARTTG